MFLNAESYIQRVLGHSGKVDPLNSDRIPTVFDKHIWFHCVNMVTSAIAARKSYVKLIYRSGNIIGLEVHRVCYAWRKRRRSVINEALSAQPLPYI